ncbi:MAG TPA: hypothetical protein VEB65_07020 [Solirubrobacterales bacterium]|nr:hypothetical protein [Solirubrobacterales bacterium]
MGFAALAVPAIASASPQLEDKEGVVEVGEGANIEGIGFGAVRITNSPFGLMECERMDFTAQMDKNSGSEIEAHGTSVYTAGCEAEGESLIVTEPTIGKLFTNGTRKTQISESVYITEEADVGTFALSFIADVGPFECPFEGTGLFLFTTGSSLIKIGTGTEPGIELSTPFEFCEPGAGKTVFEGDFVLGTEFGPGVWFS